MIFVALPKGDTHVVVPVDMINAVEPNAHAVYVDPLDASSVVRTLEGSRVSLKCDDPRYMYTDALPHEVEALVRTAIRNAAPGDASGRVPPPRLPVDPVAVKAKRGDVLTTDYRVIEARQPYSRECAEERVAILTDIQKLYERNRPRDAAQLLADIIIVLDVRARKDSGTALLSKDELTKWREEILRNLARTTSGVV